MSISAPRDDNRVPTLMGVSNTDGVTPVVVYVDPTSHRMLVTAAAGLGDVTGPVGATADDIVIFNGATGKIIKDSGKKVTDFVLGVGTSKITLAASAPSGPSAGDLWVDIS
jgi:hypothetical protein